VSERQPDRDAKTEVRAAAARAGSGRGRIALARALTVLALLIGFVSMLAFTLERTVLDESGIERVATDLIQDDAIREQVALTAVEQLYANVDVEARLAARLPEAQRGLAPTLAALSRQTADQAADRLLERPRVQAAWVTVATRTHEQLLELLEDEGEFVRTTDGTVYLDLRPVIVTLGEQIAPIGGLEERLPPTAGRIELIEAGQLDTAQTAVRVLRALAAWLWIVALAVAALAIWLARGRRRLEVRALGIGLLVVGILLLFTRRIVGSYLVDELTSDATEPAGSNAWRILTQALADRAWIWIAVGVLVLVGTWLVGPSGTGARAREAAQPVAASLLWTYGLVAGLMVVLATFLPAFQRSLFAGLVFLAILVAGVEVVRRVILSETIPRGHAMTSPPDQL
jgi:hypothetical protein